MIESDIIFDEVVNKPSGLWCGADVDDAGLAGAANKAIDNKISFVSVTPRCVPVMWPWVEKTKIQIFARFYVEYVKKDLSEMATAVINAFRHGADGVQVFLHVKDLSAFVDTVLPVRDDLFFNRKLFIGFDVCDVSQSDWNQIFPDLMRIRADGIVLMFMHDGGDKSDFVGRIVGMLNAWNNDFFGGIHLGFFQNLMRIEQFYRLVQQIKPNLKISIMDTYK